jgi:hypothetical protein
MKSRSTTAGLAKYSQNYALLPRKRKKTGDPDHDRIHRRISFQCPDIFARPEFCLDFHFVIGYLTGAAERTDWLKNVDCASGLPGGRRSVPLQYSPVKEKEVHERFRRSITPEELAAEIF